MIGQPPPFALTTPGFRFKSLASHAGRASLGGDREVALACFVAARLVAGMIPPLSIGSAEAGARTAGARQWLASLSVPAQTRTGALAAIDAVAASSPRAAVKALRLLIDAGKTQLDQASLNELTELANEVASAVTTS